jgi:molybdenum cofactor guanylyltransferase
MGADKAFIEISGVPLWRRQLQLLESLAPEQLFIAGPAHDEWQEADCIIIPDAEAGTGPLAGIVAALRESSAPLVLTLAIDLPSMTVEYLRALLSRCWPDCGVVPSYGERFEPVAAVYPKRALQLAENCLTSRDLSVQRFAARCLDDGLVSASEITPEQQPCFLNMNTPDDLATVSADASHKGHKGSPREAAHSVIL